MPYNAQKWTKISEFLLLDTLKIACWMRNLRYRCGQWGHFFLTLRTFFKFSKRGRGGLPSPLLARLLPYNKKKKKNISGNACLKATGTVSVTYRKKRSFKKAGLKSLKFSFLFFFNFTQMNPFTEICPEIWPHIQLEHSLNNYFQEQLFWQYIFSDCFWKCKIFKLSPKS